MLPIILLIIIGAIAFFQFKQGLFSALITAVCSLIAMIISMTQFDLLAGLTGLNPGYVLLLLFIVLVSGLRLLMDRMIGDDIYFSSLINKIGGAGFGLLTGIFMTGVFAVSLQLMPFGKNILGMYDPCKPNLKSNASLYPFFVDDLALGLTDSASSGALSGSTTFADRYPNFKAQTYALRSANQFASTGKLSKSAMKVIAAHMFTPDEIKSRKYLQNLPAYQFVEPGSKTKVLWVRVRVDSTSLDKCQAGPSWWNLQATQFALRSTSDKVGRVDYPIAYLFNDRNTKNLKATTPQLAAAKVTNGAAELENLIVKRDAFAGNYKPKDAKKDFKYDLELTEKELKKKYNRKYKTGGKKLFVDWIFVIPADAKPQTLTFRGVATKPVTPGKNKVKTLKKIGKDFTEFMLKKHNQADEVRYNKQSVKASK